MVECFVANENVIGSNPISRSIKLYELFILDKYYTAFIAAYRRFKMSNSIVVSGGEKGMRVIVDGSNEDSVEVAAGASQEFAFEGKLEVRVLGIEVDIPKDVGTD